MKEGLADPRILRSYPEEAVYSGHIGERGSAICLKGVEALGPLDACNSMRLGRDFDDTVLAPQ